MPDRLVLSGSDGVIGEPSLRLATELLSTAVAKEVQRDILRLEYRMLMALHEQASSQMAAAEKLRNMEGALAELQARAGEFAQRVEKDAASPVTTGQAQVAEKAPVAQAPVVTPPPFSPSRQHPAQWQKRRGVCTAYSWGRCLVSAAGWAGVATVKAGKLPPRTSR